VPCVLGLHAGESQEDVLRHTWTRTVESNLHPALSFFTLHGIELITVCLDGNPQTVIHLQRHTNDADDDDDD